MDNEIIETKNEQEIEFLTPMDVAKLMFVCDCSQCEMKGAIRT